MKKLILTGMSLLFAMTLTFAQEVTPEQKAQEKIVTLTEKLTLSEEQQTAIYPIVLEKNKAKFAIKADTTLSPESVKEQIAAISAEAHGKIAELLTEEQKVAFAKIVEEKEANKED